MEKKNRNRENATKKKTIRIEISKINNQKNILFKEEKKNFVLGIKPYYVYTYIHTYIGDID